MVALQSTHDPILNSNAQVLLLPVNTAGIWLDPILTRSKSLYPDNYQRYHRACREGSLIVGSCLLHQRIRECAGLSASHNGNQPSYIANLVICDHPYHPTRTRWLEAALLDFCQQIIPLIRYQGVRKMALLARPLISSQQTKQTTDDPLSRANNANTLPLDWQATTLPLLIKYLQHLPKVHTTLHLPKNMALTLNDTET